MGDFIKGPWSLASESQTNLLTPSKKMEYVAIDVETTGLNKIDRIIEVGIVAFREEKVIEEWSTLINPQRDVGKTSIHGITSSMVSTAPIFSEVINDIFRLINGRVLVAHNLFFDSRMLIQELKRTEAHGEIGKGFCTMIASRRMLAGSGDSLSSTCSALGIPTINSHTALGDARMTMQIFNQLIEDEQKVIPALVEYRQSMIPSRVLVRDAFASKPHNALQMMRTITQKVPFPSSEEKYIAYLLMLNMAMQDLVISEHEHLELSQWAEDLGISESEIENLHKSYLDSFIQAALRDNVITETERNMIKSVGKSLKLPVVIPDKPQKIQTNEDNLNSGARVCFTGEAIDKEGNSIHRIELEKMASRLGLFPVKDVTKKGCDILVAADIATMSGKAKKAKEWGITVISVDKFMSYCKHGK